MTLLAAIQYKPPKGNVREARSELQGLICKAGDEGAKIIVCPEMATSGYFWEEIDSLRSHAEPALGQTAELLRKISRKDVLNNKSATQIILSMIWLSTLGLTYVLINHLILTHYQQINFIYQ